MIAGVVTPALRAMVRLRVRGQNNQEEEVEAFIDTGFTRFLMLPSAVIGRLNLLFTGTATATLADGDDVELDVFEGILWWDGQERVVEVLQTESGALVGMALLYGHDVRIQVVDGGSVTIEALN